MGRGVGHEREPKPRPSGRRSFFYLVETYPPTVDEFRSYFERGKTPENASPREVYLHKGVSMFETVDQVRKLARRMSDNYKFIVEVSVPEGVRAERHGKSAGHHNVYAPAADLKSWVVNGFSAR